MLEEYQRIIMLAVNTASSAEWTSLAPPLMRAIQRELQDPLARRLLAGDFEEGETIVVNRGPEGLTFSVTLPVVEGEVVA